MTEIEKLLCSLGIPFEAFEHGAVFTCEEAAALSHIPGTPMKNLFLVAPKEGKHYLVAVSESKRVDLKGLADVLDVKKLSFGGAAEMQELLGVTPGSVTLLAAVNDRDNQVRMVLDHELANVAALQCHPLINTRTIVISSQDLTGFFELMGHPLEILAVPAR